MRITLAIVLFKKLPIPSKNKTRVLPEMRTIRHRKKKEMHSKMAPGGLELQ
jgi:hypothetical protein